MVACGLRGVLLCFDQRSFQLDFQIIANQESSSFKRRVPIKTEIAALDPRGCRGADPGIPPGVFCLRRRDFYFQNHLLGHSMDRQEVLKVEVASAETKDPLGNARIGASATTRIKRSDFVSRGTRRLKPKASWLAIM